MVGPLDSYGYGVQVPPAPKQGGLQFQWTDALATNNWNDLGNWEIVNADGSTSPAPYLPTNQDLVTFTANSPAVCIVNGNATCAAIDSSAWTGTLEIAAGDNLFVDSSLNVNTQSVLGPNTLVGGLGAGATLYFGGGGPVVIECQTFGSLTANTAPTNEFDVYFFGGENVSFTNQVYDDSGNYDSSIASNYIAATLQIGTDPTGNGNTGLRHGWHRLHHFRLQLQLPRHAHRKQ